MGTWHDTSPKMDEFNDSFNPYSLDDWQTLATKSLRGVALTNLTHTTAGGLLIDPLFSDRPEANENLMPSPLMRWDNRLAVIGDNPQAQNATLLEGLRGGISSAQIDLAYPEKKSWLQTDMLSAALQDVQLDIIPISVMAGSQFTAAARQVESIWSNQNISAEAAAASFNADPVGTLAAAGTLSNNLDHLLTEMTQLVQHANTHFPKVKTVCVNSTCYHNAGASLEQELAASIATAVVYMESMLDAGLSPQVAHDAITFQVACDADTLSNVVKLRALKALWHHTAKQLGVAQVNLALVVETSLRMQARTEPWVNHLRNVSAAAAAAMGGAQSIIVHPHNRIDNTFVDDEVELGARVARNIAIILSEESAMTFVHDPMGGSYAVENLTNDLCKNTWQALQQLEHTGGLIQSLNSGQWQSEIASSQNQRVARLRNEQDVQVAVNRYVSNTPAATNQKKPSMQPEPASTSAQPLCAVRDASAFEPAS